MKVINKSKSTVVAKEAKIADTFKTRCIGLLNRKTLPPNEALIVTRCQSIHMFFMRFPIDVIFVDKDDNVVGLVREIKPFRLSPIYFSASFAVEAAVGAIERSQTQLGDRIIFE